MQCYVRKFYVVNMYSNYSQFILNFKNIRLGMDILQFNDSGMTKLPHFNAVIEVGNGKYVVNFTAY